MCYSTYNSTGSSKRTNYLRNQQLMGDLGMRTDKEGKAVPITLDDLNLVVKIQAGESYEVDVTCDSEFMIRTIPEVGVTLREQYYWVPDEDPIYLVMDNAGGHGTDNAKEVYTRKLLEFNVQIIWQVP